MSTPGKDQGLSGQAGAGCVLAIAHFPPPVHGMAVAVEAFADILDRVAQSERLPVHVERITVASAQRRMLYHHLERGWRVLGALRAVLRHRRNGTLYLSADAGAGMVYTCSLVLIAALCGIPTYLHHHSSAYLRERRGSFRLIARAGRRNVTHLVGCETMARQVLIAAPQSRVQALPILYAVASRGTSRGLTPGSVRKHGSKPLVLGHLSNLSLAKGFDLAFGTRQALAVRGIDSRLVLAGKPPARDERDLFHALLRSANGAADYLGPVYAAGREAFFDEIDVFVFPSRYRHESFGLVLGEALIRRIPVITFATTCLDHELVGSAGLVLQSQAAFPDRAADWLMRMRHGGEWDDAVWCGIATFGRKRQDAEAKASAVALAMLRSSMRNQRHSSEPQ